MKPTHVDSGSRAPIAGDASPTAPAARAPNAARRRLMLGVALPSVLTLASGARIASATTLVRVVNPDDKWYRAQVKAGKQGNAMAYCIMDKQAGCTDPYKPTTSANQSVWYVQDQRKVVASGDIKEIGTYPNGYGLVYIDKKGTVATLDPQANLELSPVQDSTAAYLSAKSLNLG